MKVHAAETTFNVQFVQRVQKLANTQGLSTGEAAIELMVTAHAPPTHAPVAPVAPVEAVSEGSHIDIEA